MKKFCVLLLTAALLLSLAGCGPSLSSGDLIGVWSGAWEGAKDTSLEGININVSIEFKRDGTYSKVVYHDNSFVSVETGTYTIDGKVVDTYDDGQPVFPGVSPVSIPYKYSKGKLTNNGHSLSKEQ